jgi:hypothetical protein
MTILSGMKLVATSTFSINSSTGTGAGGFLSLGLTVPIGALTMIRFDRFELTNGRFLTLGGVVLSFAGGTIVANAGAPKDIMTIATATFSDVIAWSAQSPASTLLAVGRYSIFKFASSLE